MCKEQKFVFVWKKFCVFVHEKVAEVKVNKNCIQKLT